MHFQRKMNNLNSYKTLILSSVVLLCGLNSAAKIKRAEDDSSPSSVGNIPPSLSIENLLQGEGASRRSRTTLDPSSVAESPTTTTRHPLEDSDTVLYRLNNQQGRACILILTDAIVEIDFVTNLKEKREVSVFVPSVYQPTGNCDSGDDAWFTIAWSNFKWTTYFSKTPGGDHWYVQKMTLDADTQDKHLAHINRPPSVLHFESKNQGGMLFPTPVGQAYACEEELSVVLGDGDITATVLLRKLKMQPFIFKKDEFGPAHICSPGGAKAYRDETAPIAVGSTMAVVSILTVAGYGVYRYMKVKKVQYDTME